MCRLPILTVIISVAAHAAFLFAPDPNPPGVKLALYAVAGGGTLFVAFGLLRRMRQRITTDQRPWLRGELAARFAEVLIFVGAGYCTIVEPGVIKLFGVLPLGWSCAIAALWLELTGALGLARGLDSRPSWDQTGFKRIVGVGLATLAQCARDLMGHSDAAILELVLGLTLLWLLTDVVKTAAQLLRTVPAERD